MATQRNGITTYKRDKKGMEISGDPNDVKQSILIDQLINGMCRILIIAFMLAMLLSAINKDNSIPEVLKWVKQLLPFMTLFVAVVGWMQVFLSG